jgi:hypothetical protein
MKLPYVMSSVVGALALGFFGASAVAQPNGFAGSNTASDPSGAGSAGVKIPQ